MTSEGRNTKHAILSLKGQMTSVHSEEPQRVTENEGRMKPSRGKRGTKDGAARRQDGRDETSAIDMNGGLCLGKRRRCVDNGGPCTVKRKRGIPKDVCGRAGREGVPRDETATPEVAEDTEAESTNTDVRETKYHSERVHGAERSARRAMWPRKGRATSTGMIGDEVRRMTVPNRGSQRKEFGEHRRVWWIGWSLRFEIIRWRWWTGR